MYPKSCKNCIHFPVCLKAKQLKDSFFYFWHELKNNDLVNSPEKFKDRYLDLMMEEVASSCIYYWETEEE